MRQDRVRDGHLVPLVARLHRLLDAVLLDDLTGRGHEGLTPGLAGILPLIGPDGARPIAIAERSGMTRQGVGQNLRELEARGLVEFSDDPDERRAKVVRCTARGWTLRDAIEAARRELEARTGAPGELARLKSHIARVIDILEAPRAVD